MYDEPAFNLADTAVHAPKAMGLLFQIMEEIKSPFYTVDLEAVIKFEGGHHQLHVVVTPNEDGWPERYDDKHLVVRRTQAVIDFLVDMKTNKLSCWHEEGGQRSRCEVSAENLQPLVAEIRKKLEDFVSL
jgi:hypothetical protein